MIIKIPKTIMINVLVIVRIFFLELLITLKFIIYYYTYREQYLSEFEIGDRLNFLKIKYFLLFHGYSATV